MPPTDAQKGHRPAGLWLNDPKTILKEVDPRSLPDTATTALVGVSVSRTFQLLSGVLTAHGFEVGPPRSPVLPLTHDLIDGSTPHGSTFGERNVTQVGSGVLGLGRCYSSEVVLAFVDVDPTSAEASSASMNEPISLRVTVGQGRVETREFHGKRSVHRAITAVAHDPGISSVIPEIIAALQSTQGGGPPLRSEPP